VTHSHVVGARAASLPRAPRLLQHLPPVPRWDGLLLDAPDLQDEHPAGAELDGPPKGDAVDEAAVEVVTAVDLHGREQAGNRGGGEDGVDDRPTVEPVLRGVLDPGGAALERHRQVVDPLATELRGEGATQGFRGVRCGAGARELPQSGESAGGEDLGGVRRAPQCFQTIGDLRRRAGREDRAVDRPHAGADHEIGADARVEERAEHADLHGTEHSPAAEDHRRADAFRSHRLMLARASR
jgi:hypothetical protein